MWGRTPKTLISDSGAKYEWIKVGDGIPTLELLSPTTVTVWVRTDNPYADKYGTGFYDYESAQWVYFGASPGFNVTHWAEIVPPREERV